jgi:hypothetical protein
MKRLITRPRSLLLVVALAVVAAMCTVSTAHAASSASETVVPAAPSNLTATAVSPDSVRLTWTNNAANQSGVVISLDGVESVDVQGGHGQLLHWGRAVTGHEVLVLHRVEDLWHAGRPDRLRQHAVRMGRPGLRDHTKNFRLWMGRIVVLRQLP